MRLITKQAINAFNNNEDFSKDNTQVVATGNVVMLYLFGNQIAKKVLSDYESNKWDLFITHCVYKTNTTRERLNGLDGVSIKQKKGVWYLNGNPWDGKSVLVD